jgi:hypothetical protein
MVYRRPKEDRDPKSYPHLPSRRRVLLFNSKYITRERTTKELALIESGRFYTEEYQNLAAENDTKALEKIGYFNHENT